MVPINMVKRGTGRGGKRLALWERLLGRKRAGGRAGADGSAGDKSRSGARRESLGVSGCVCFWASVSLHKGLCTCVCLGNLCACVCARV